MRINITSTFNPTVHSLEIECDSIGPGIIDFLSAFITTVEASPTIQLHSSLDDKCDEPPSSFKQELINLINKHSRENNSNTPDWVLASYIISCLDAYEAATNQREELKCGVTTD